MTTYSRPVSEDGIVYKLTTNDFDDKFWKLDGKYHRMSGPAIEYSNGKKEWYYHGIKIPCRSQEEFERILKLKAFW